MLYMLSVWSLLCESLAIDNSDTLVHLSHKTALYRKYSILLSSWVWHWCSALAAWLLLIYVTAVDITYIVARWQFFFSFFFFYSIHSINCIQLTSICYRKNRESWLTHLLIFYSDQSQKLALLCGGLLLTYQAYLVPFCQAIVHLKWKVMTGQIGFKGNTLKSAISPTVSHLRRPHLIWPCLPL